MTDILRLTTGVVYLQSGSVISPGTVLASSGTVTAPSYAFTSDASNDSGFYLIGANNIGAAAGGALIWDWDATPRLTIFTPALAATSAAKGLLIANNTASTSGVPVQMSGRLQFRSNVWNTTAVAANNTDDWFIESLPASGLTPSGLLKFGSSLNGATATYPMTLSSAGVLRLYSLATDDSNYTRLSITGTEGAPGNFTVVPSQAGAGSDNVDILINALGTGKVSLSGNALYTDGNGVHFDSAVTFPNDNTYNLGASGTTRPKDVYIAGRYYIGGSGTITSASKLTKKVTAIADNSATTVLTVTVPNGNHAAAVKLTFLSSNGGADAFESSRVATGHVVIQRITGASAVATAATIDDAAIATCATGGSATHTLAYSVVANAEGAGGTETVSIKVTIDDSGNLGSSQCIVLAELVNSEASGVTIA